MPVITLSRQLGSGGDEVAAAVGSAWACACGLRTDQPRGERRRARPRWRWPRSTNWACWGSGPAARPPRYREKIFAVVGELADEGNLLLVGRGGQVILAGRPGVLHVRMIAPGEQRVARLAETRGISAEAAAARIEASDRARVDFVRRYYGANSQSPDLYDMILNLAQIDITTATDLISVAAQRVAGAAASGGDR